MNQLVISVLGLMMMAGLFVGFKTVMRRCPPGQCHGHLTRFGVGYCDRASCLERNPGTTTTVDLLGAEKK